MISYLKNTEGYKMDFFKGKKYDEILPIFQAKFDANMRFSAQKAAKRRKLSEEAQEADDLRKRLVIVQDEDDDVFVEATLLAQKDAIWRNQKSVYGLALVKRWKLLTSCGVHVIILSTVQLFLLVGRRYLLSRFTLEQLVNVAILQVEEENVLSYQAALESVEARLVLYKQNESIFEDNIIVLKNKVAAKDHFISNIKQKLKEAETERGDLKLKFEKFQLSSKNLSELIASQSNNKHSLSYLPSEDVSANLSLNCPSDKVQPSGGYNVVPPQITRNFMPPKPDLVFNTAHIAVETAHSAFTVKLSSSEPAQDLSHTNRPSTPIIEEWVSDSEDDYETTAPQIAHSSVQSTKQVTPPRHSVQPVEAPILADTPKPTSPNTSSGGKRKNRKTCFVSRSVDHLIKDCNYHAMKKAQPT
nr:hypothetical protein [Tanacetum cinerariifolium]